jgi:ribosome maturation factor RimP
MSKITDAVLALAQPVAESQGIEIWDVEFVKEAGTRFLRIYIDKAEGVSIQDCESFSRALDPILDEADPIPESYTFEVSSAGAERVLKRPGDFERFLGSDVYVKLYQPIDGSKQFVGVLQGYEDGNVTILQNGNNRTFDKSSVAQVRLHITF